MPVETDIRPLPSYFPLDSPREKQVKAMDFIQRKYADGYRDLIIAAPTGIGKTAIGDAVCFWAGSTSLSGQLGGYYLVTQKLLQDQIENDFPRFRKPFTGMGATLKSSVEYPCPQYGTCMAGGRQKKEKRCAKKETKACPYTRAYNAFSSMPIACTNYPYFFTERTYIGNLKPRQTLICDECHTVEKQVLGFIEISITTEALAEWAPQLRPVPDMPSVEEFTGWLESTYIPVIKSRYEMILGKAAESSEKRVHQELLRIENHLGRITTGINGLKNCPENWVYWQEKKDGELESTAKPIDASPFTKDLLFCGGELRVYMSAYPGPKSIFCRSLGLDESKTAMLQLNSTFPIAHRPVHLLFVGSMGRKSQDATRPALLRKIDKILTVHKGHKGVIHCHSYQLGDAIDAYLQQTEHAGRILYPRRSEQRTSMFLQHVRCKEPTVMLSPSMTEGFSLDNDLARFQVIAKVPYPYLGDKQVAAKKERDNDWYVMQTCMTLIQGCGRAVRSDTDWASTYVLDSDFAALYERYSHFFPPWFQQAFQWH